MDVALLITSNIVTFFVGSGGTNTSTDNDGKVIGILFGCSVIAYIIGIVMIALRLSNWCIGKTYEICFLRFCIFIEEIFFDCCGSDSIQANSLLGFMYLVLYGVIVEVIVLVPVYYEFAKFQEVLVIGVGIGIVLVLSFLCLVVVWILMKFVNNGTSEIFCSLSCIRICTVTPDKTCKSQKRATIDQRQQPDGDEVICV